MTSAEFLSAYPGIEFKKYESNPTGGYTYLAALVPNKYKEVLQSEVIADKCAEHFGFWLGTIKQKTNKGNAYGFLIQGWYVL